MTWKPLVTLITPVNQERSVLRAQLLGANFNVTAVHDPAGALSRLADGIPHLIIADRRQVEKQSKTFAKLLNQLEDTSPVPILFLLDRDEGESVPGLLRDGLDDTITRPARSLELLARTTSLLRNRQLLGQIRIQESFLRSRGIEPQSNGDLLPTVLLVEDETSELENISRLLGQVPCQTIQARTPSEALWRIRQKTPHLVIVDLLFPDLDGLELCRYLKKQEETRYTPLLMLTAVPELDNRIEGMESGPDDYLVKPVNSVEVLTRVRRLLDRHRSHRRLLGNNLLLGSYGYTDLSTGIPKEEFFRFVYPQMVHWSQAAQLPFTVARIRVSSGPNFLKLAAQIRSTLRNFDLDFITGESDLSLILPETSSGKAQIALSRIMAKAEDIGIPPWELRLVTVSIGEEGWEADQISETLKTRTRSGKDPEETGERIVVAAPGEDGEALADLLRSGGFPQVETVPLDNQREPGEINASLVIFQGDMEKVPELMDRFWPSLPGTGTPILIRYTGNGQNIPASSVPITADYIPPGATDEYFLHRVKNSLDFAQVRSGCEEAEQFLRKMVRLLEEGDTDVQGHGQQVSNWAVAMGSRLGLGKEEQEALRWGGLLHDVGKIFLPWRIISREGMLSAEEYMVVKSHPGLGHDLCRAFSMLNGALPIIKHHHERMDGKGYPEGLKGGKIPLLARIVSVVDVFETLLRRRPFRPPFPRDEAVRILKTEARKGLWDEKIVDEFLEMMEK